MRYWTEGSGDESTLKSTWRRPYYGPRSNDIEMTSYALLTYVRRNESAMAAPIMKWIASKQNELGGYSSTQVILRISGCVNENCVNVFATWRNFTASPAQIFMAFKSSSIVVCCVSSKKL